MFYAFLIIHRAVINMECCIDNSGMIVYTMVWFYTHDAEDAEEALFTFKQVHYDTIFIQLLGLRSMRWD